MKIRHRLDVYALKKNKKKETSVKEERNHSYLQVSKERDKQKQEYCWLYRRNIKNAKKN